MMKSDEVRAFLQGQALYAFDPQTALCVALVRYGPDGRCEVEFASGDTDQGIYGFDGDTYWTRYTTFRQGETHSFHLQAIAPGLAQAYFVDGTIAFLQSYHAELSGCPKSPV